MQYHGTKNCINIPASAVSGFHKPTAIAPKMLKRRTADIANSNHYLQAYGQVYYLVRYSHRELIVSPSTVTVSQGCN